MTGHNDYLFSPLAPGLPLPELFQLSPADAAFLGLRRIAVVSESMAANF